MLMIGPVIWAAAAAASANIATKSAEAEPVQPTFMFETGTTLLSKCRNKAPEYALACTAYIAGAMDGVKKEAFLGRARPNCWPPQLAMNDARKTVITYLERWPDQRKSPASVLISVALNERYSCVK